MGTGTPLPLMTCAQLPLNSGAICDPSLLCVMLERSSSVRQCCRYSFVDFFSCRQNEVQHIILISVNKLRSFIAFADHTFLPAHSHLFYCTRHPRSTDESVMIPTLLRMQACDSLAFLNGLNCLPLFCWSQLHFLPPRNLAPVILVLVLTDIQHLINNVQP